ncbi:MAG: NapC/NirT family cytochrome c [Coriobacteriales bacterium]|nr:NapC/NirT family cytochrome c [Coriobacteriales bacterium]
MGFTNPFSDSARRPRAIIWLVVIVIGVAGIAVGAQVLTSSAWFCNDICHNVHQDNAAEYDRSAHANVNCVACHYRPGMSALLFTVDRVDKLLDVYPTIVGELHWPMNLYSHLAAVTVDEQCEQCHKLENTRVLTSPGIKIDHRAHKDKGINCAQCHNRVAHPERGYKLRLPYNKKKQDFATMPGCMRCHRLSRDEELGELSAPGQCSTCHTRDFELTPRGHAAKDWADPRGSSRGHADAAKAAQSFSETQEKIWAGAEEEFYEKRPRLLARIAIGNEPVFVKVPPYWTQFECSNCHTERFCTDCHGVELPHPENFKRSHVKDSKESEAPVCGKCHNPAKRARFVGSSCSQCHHPQFKPARGSWVRTHGAIAKEIDTQAECLICHKKNYCSSCHVRGKPSTAY